MLTAVVTGADRGLGLSITTGLAKMGWRVFAGKFLEEYSLLEELKKEYPEVYPVKLDVSKRSDILAAKEYVAGIVDHVDMIVSNAAMMGGPNDSTIHADIPIGFDNLELAMLTNSLGGPQVCEVFLPLLEKSDYKRLCFVSSEVSSIRLMLRDGGVRYPMSKSALNMAVRMLHNTLYEKGYSFRLYQPGWMRRVNPDGTRAQGAEIDPDFSAEEALRQFTNSRLDEQRLVLTDYEGHELSF